MSSEITVQDIADQMNDYIGNYTTGSIDLGNRMRAINRAIEYLKRYMTFPSDELVQKIYFYEGTMFYNLNSDFNEGLTLYYDTVANNKVVNQWTYVPYAQILTKVGLRPGHKYWSWAGINGKMQLVIYGHNLNQGQIIASFDDLVTGGFVGQNDATGLAIDTNIYSEGSGSLSFEINPTLGGTGMASIYWPTNYDFYNELQNSGIFNLDVWLPDGNLSEINLVLMTDSNDYYTLSATEFNDGTAFSAGLNQWKTLAFSFNGDAVVGSPDIQNITAIRVDFVLNGSFGTSTVPDFRIDNMKSVIPDLLDLIYLTSYKGTDTTGATNKIFLTEYTDIPAFGNFFPDMIDVVAMRAAVILAPQILSNTSFAQMFKAENERVIGIVGRSWPRKRTLNYGKLQLSRR